MNKSKKIEACTSRRLYKVPHLLLLSICSETAIATLLPYCLLGKIRRAPFPTGEERHRMGYPRRSAAGESGS